MGEIRACSVDHAERYGEIYAKAFSGDPWNDPWKPEDAVIHVKEILEMKQSYGLEYVENNLAVGFLPEFYERHGFGREKEVILMGMEL